MPEKLKNLASQLFTDAGFITAIDTSYGGTMVLNSVLNGQSDCRLESIMIEVNKKRKTQE